MKNPENELYENGMKTLAAFQSGKFAFTSALPKLTKFLKIKVVDGKYKHFFLELIHDQCLIVKVPLPYRTST